MSKSVNQLLLDPAIAGPASGRGWRINGFGLIVIALVTIVALVKAPGVFGGGVFVGGVWKVVKLVQKKTAPTKPRGCIG